MSHIFIYTIESDNSAAPEVLLFATRDEMRKRFIQDIIEDERDPFGKDDVHRDEGEDYAGPTLLQLIVAKETGKPLDQQFEMAASIYEAIVENGDGNLPLYHGFNEEEPIKVPEPPATYTVFLLYPDKGDVDTPIEDCMLHAVGNTPEEAINDARRECFGMNNWTIGDRYNLEDLYCIACIKGAHQDVKP